MGDFHHLQVWQKAHRLTLDIYKCSATFPKDETFGLSSQLRRASSSIGANIAEGSGRGGDREFVRFLHISSGSATELEYHLLLAHDLGYCDEHDYERMATATDEVKGMLRRLIERVGMVPNSRLETRDS